MSFSVARFNITVARVESVKLLLGADLTLFRNTLWPTNLHSYSLLCNWMCRANKQSKFLLHAQQCTFEQLFRLLNFRN